MLPAIGTKEMVGLLPSLLGLGPGDVVVVPELAYPTYEIGALLTGAHIIRSDRPDLDARLQTLDPAGNEGPRVRLVWLNSPSNPTGAVMDADAMRAVVAWARARGAVVASDECYIELGWTRTPVSALHPDVCGGSTAGVLAIHSLSKRSNLAGYRAGFVVGDGSLLGEMLAVRKHLGLIVPGPVQAAARVALDDDEHVAEQRERYARRRSVLYEAVTAAGLRVDESHAGLYLWASRDEDCWATVSWFADRGVLVAPGEFYGPAGAQHVRIALTATDERVDAAVARLAAG